METRNYGTSGDKTAAIGFGAMRFEDPQNLDKSAATVLRAFEKGVTYFDTAPGYCQDKSEIAVGMAVKEMKKSGKPFTVSTKSSNPDGDALRKQLEQSLKRLNVDTIDFYHCWCVITLESWEQRKKQGAVAAILKAKEEGLIRHAAISTHLPGSQIRQVLEEGYFDGVTLGYSAINSRYRQEGIAAAAKRGMGVVVMNPLGGGMIPANPDIFDFLKVRPEQNMLEAALHYLMSDPRIAVSLVGFRNDDDVDTATAAAESFIHYTDEEVQAINAKARSEFDSFCTTCKYCDVCPEDIPVWAFMEAHNHFRLNKGEKIEQRLKWHWGTDMSQLERCTSCRRCERACTQQLPILERFEELKQGFAVQEAERLKK